VLLDRGSTEGKRWRTFALPWESEPTISRFLKSLMRREVHHKQIACPLRSHHSIKLDRYPISFPSIRGFVGFSRTADHRCLSARRGLFVSTDTSSRQPYARPFVSEGSELSHPRFRSCRIFSISPRVSEHGVNVCAHPEKVEIS
jgi:hypothetical protein